MPYFQKEPWAPHHYGALDHLNEFVFVSQDRDGIERSIAVTFSDHCFTRTDNPSGTPNLIYLGCSRNPGYFCHERYGHSIRLPEMIRAISTVWNLGGERCALTRFVDHNGNRVNYGIIFTLDPVNGLPVQFHMRIRSAHVRDQSELRTYGALSFSELVSLRLVGKHP